jgi:hypothetical protein
MCVFRNVCPNHFNFRRLIPSSTGTFAIFLRRSWLLIVSGHLILRRQEPGSSVSIVSDYGLDDRAIGVRSPAEAKDFPSNLCVQTGSGAHPASCTMGTGGSFPGGKVGQGVTLTAHSHLVPRSGMSTSYTPSPPKRLRGV